MNATKRAALQREEETPFTNPSLHLDMQKKGVVILALVSGIMINQAVLIIA